MKLIFRGWVSKNWINVNQRQSYAMKKMNKVIVKHSVIFYSSTWVYRNKILYDEETYWAYLIDWHKRIVEEAERGDKPSIRRYVRMQKLNIEKSETSYIRLWNESTVKMMKNAKKEPVNDIRNYFSIRWMKRGKS